MYSVDCGPFHMHPDSTEHLNVDLLKYMFLPRQFTCNQRRGGNLLLVGALTALLHLL